MAINACDSTPESSELLLSNYPELFESDALIVVGENASQIELRSAEAIASHLEELAGSEPTTKTDGEVSENDKSEHNLILVGTPSTNSLLQEVYDVTNATLVTAESPGENRGILEILVNPWNEQKAVLLVAGSDEWGTWATLEILDRSEERDERIVMSEFQSPQESVFLDRYVFLEHFTHTYWQVIEGDYRGPIIDSPTYSFDGESGTLRSYLHLDIRASLLVYGRGSSASGVGSGTENMLYGAYELPWEFDDITILKIGVNGTAYFTYNDNLIVLKQGQKWENIVSEVDTSSSGTAKLTITDRIENHGFLQKSQVDIVSQ